jgi:arylsulfatase A-like enzyme
VARSKARWLGVASMVTALGLAAGCSGGSDEGEPTKRLQAKPKQSLTKAPVADSRTEDPVLGSDPLPTPRFRSPVDQPNLLMITADDASIEDLEHMPHVQELMADQGVRIENGIAPTPICVPARVSLLTGQYSHNHGALTIEGDGGGFASFEDDGTLPVWLQDAGYDTLFVGKYLNGYGMDDDGAYVPPGWSSWRATVDPTTYNFLRSKVSRDGVAEVKDQYSSDRLTDLSVELLEDPDRDQKPWYLWLNYVAPHVGGPNEPDDPHVVYPDDPESVGTPRVADRHRDSFSDLELPDKPSIFEKDISDKGHVRGVRVKWQADGKAQMREAHQQRVESLQAVDEGVARIVETLRANGQLDDTYIVFESDNGYFVGEHNLGGKLWHYAESIGVPMLVRGPGLPQGETVQTPVTQVDWAPTFAALAGAEPTRPLDGVNVIPWLTSQASSRVVPIEAYPVMGGREPIYNGIWAGEWTYVQLRGGVEELYYRGVDPYELSNLAGDRRFRTQLKELRALNEEFSDCSGSGCPVEFYS